MALIIRPCPPFCILARPRQLTVEAAASCLLYRVAGRLASVLSPPVNFLVWWVSLFWSLLTPWGRFIIRRRVFRLPVTLVIRTVNPLKLCRPIAFMGSVSCLLGL